MRIPQYFAVSLDGSGRWAKGDDHGGASPSDRVPDRPRDRPTFRAPVERVDSAREARPTRTGWRKVHRTGLRGLALGLIAIALLLVASGPPRAASAPSGTASALPAVQSGVTLPTPIQHVFTIVLENAGLSGVLSGGPYLKTLYDTYAGADHYYGVCHPSAPNYLGMTSGQPFQCGTDNVNSYSATNIADLVTAKGETWAAYMESMPSPCYPGWWPLSGKSLYKPGHDPFIYYSDLGVQGAQSGPCYSNDLPLSSFNPANTPPNYVFLSPNLLNDGHNTTVAYASNWLSGYLPTLLAEPWAASTVFFIVYDEGLPSDSSGYDGLNGGHTYLAAVSPYTLGVGIYTPDSSPYSLLSTIEWLLGTGNTGANDGKSAFGPMKSMFSFNGTSPPSKYDVSGSVQAPNGSAVAGAEVFANSSTNTSHRTSQSNGTFTFLLPNGSYAVTAVRSGFHRAETNVTVAGGPVGGLLLTLVPTNSSGPPSNYSVSGSVRAKNGTALAGAEVFANSTQGNFSSATGPTGAYSFQLENATYSVTAVDAGFSPAETNVTVDGASVAGVNLTLSPESSHGPPPTLYPVAFTELGLLPGSTWSVRVASENLTSSNDSVTMDLANGSYPFTVGGPVGFLAVPSSGTFQVAGTGLTERIAFEPVSPPPRQYSVSFAPTGLPTGLLWAVELGGSSSQSNGTIAWTLPNGSYPYSVLAPAGFSATPASGSVQVAGANLTVTVSFAPTSGGSPPTYPVVFVQSGLSSGTRWWVAVAAPNGTVNVSSSAATITLNLTNGTYPYSVGSGPGYVPDASAGTLVVPGAGQHLTVHFAVHALTEPSPDQSSSSFGLRGSIAGTLVAMLAGLAIGLAVTMDLLLRVGPRVARSGRRGSSRRRSDSRRPPP